MRRNSWIILTLCIAVIGMGIGYASLSQNLEVNATANITGQWDVRIGGVGVFDWNGASEVANDIAFDGTSATFEVDLEYPGAWAIYSVFVYNFGNIDATLSSINGISAANMAEPSEISITLLSDDHIGSDLVVHDFHRIQIMVEWKMPPDGIFIPQDVKSKTATINVNYTQAI